MADEQAEQIAQDIPKHENHGEQAYRPGHRTQDLSAHIPIEDFHPTPSDWEAG